VRPSPPLLPTTVVGSHPQPDWLIDRKALASGRVPRIRMPELWRIEGDLLAAAQDDATLLALRDMERAGIDIVSDGEVRRESYSCTFATALEGIVEDDPVAVTGGSSGREVRVPRVVGPIRRRGPVEVRNLEFLLAHTDRPVKVSLPGPFTMAQQAHDEHYHDHDELVLAYAAALNEELLDLEAAGADAIQIDEPWLREDPAAAERIAVAGIDRALAGLTVPTIVHLCFGYAAIVGGDKPSGYPFLEQLAGCAASHVSIEAAQPRIDLGVLAELAPKTIVLGVLDLGDPRVERAEEVAGRIRAALRHVPAERLAPAPDCGMKYLPREVARGKLAALAAGAAIVRGELSGHPGVSDPK
jgi:5-methyltetrahydropteroyltriglutamate--homocysteine methyltransferase